MRSRLPGAIEHLSPRRLATTESWTAGFPFRRPMLDRPPHFPEPQPPNHITQAAQCAVSCLTEEVCMSVAESRHLRSERKTCYGTRLRM
jgi:hypothetical protein